MTKNQWGLTISSMIAAAGLLSCAFIATALAISTDDPAIPEAAPRPEREFDGAAYLYQDGRRFSETPKFVIPTTGRDRREMQSHVTNLALTRHWVTSESVNWTRVYIMPDYDVDIIREIAREPEGWVHEFARNPPESPERPPAEALMAVEIYFDADYRQAPYAIAAGTAGLIGVIALLCVVGFAIDVAKERENRIRAGT